MKKSFATAAVKRTVHSEERSRPENRWEWVGGKRRKKVGSYNQNKNSEIIMNSRFTENLHMLRGFHESFLKTP